MPPARDTAVAVAHGRFLTTELSEVTSWTSFSVILDGHRPVDAPHVDPGLITLDQKILDPVYLIALGLNEECRKLRRGLFYHLPLRQNFDFGHPCDLVFIDEDWDPFGCEKWDESNWRQRLMLCEARAYIDPSEEVIPINTRIHIRNIDLEDHSFCLPCSLDRTKVDKAHCPHALQQATEQTWLSFMMSHAGVDPAVTVGNSHYSRTLADISSFLIHYSNLESLGFVCLTNAAENESLCNQFPTPRDMSITFARDGDLSVVTVEKDQHGRPTRGAKAARLVVEGTARNNVEIVQELLRVWDKTDWSEYAEPHSYGRIKYYWGDIIDGMEYGERDWRDASRASFWPSM